MKGHETQKTSPSEEQSALLISHHKNPRRRGKDKKLKSGSSLSLGGKKRVKKSGRSTRKNPGIENAVSTSRREGEDGLLNADWYCAQNITPHLPISFLYSISQTLKFALVCVAACGALELLAFANIGALHLNLDQVSYIAQKLAVVAVLTKLIFWEMQRRSLRLQVNGFNLRVLRGVFLPYRVTFVIGPFMSVVIDESPFERVFGLVSLKIITINSPTSVSLHLPCITRKVADRFHYYIADQINRQAKIAARAEQEEEQLQHRAKESIRKSRPNRGTRSAATRLKRRRDNSSVAMKSGSRRVATQVHQTDSVQLLG